MCCFRYCGNKHEQVSWLTITANVFLLMPMAGVSAGAVYIAVPLTGSDTRLLSGAEIGIGRAFYSAYDHG